LTGSVHDSTDITGGASGRRPCVGNMAFDDQLADLTSLWAGLCHNSYRSLDRLIIILERGLLEVSKIYLPV
jgi:hypothetical protein